MISGAETSRAKYMIYTDGGCSFNPGGPGGYGVVILDTETGEERELSQGYLSTTNNRMEIMAIIAGLENIEDGCTAVVFSDSQYAIKCASGEWSRGKNRDLWERYEEVSRGKRLAFQWVKGHSGVRQNERCDSLASEAMYSAGRIEDAGYREAKERGREYYKEVEAVEKRTEQKREIVLPESFAGQKTEFMSRSAYAEKYRVHTSCAAAILDFKMLQKKNFAAYVKLKTGGIDFWSSKKKEEIMGMVQNGKAAWDILTGYFTEERDRMAALRWYARGLPLQDCIRKIQVDKEVTENAIRK